MSFVFATPEYLAGAASDLANIGTTISSANAMALGPTSGVLAAGADEVSAGIAALFDAHSQAYQLLSAQAAQFHEQFVQLMSGGGAQYALAEAENASPLLSVGQEVASGVTSPLQASASAPASGPSAAAALAGDAGGVPSAFGPGGSGAAGQLVSSVGAGPAAAAVGDGGGSFGPGGAGYAGSLVAGQTPAGLANSGGAVVATESAEEFGIGEAPAAVAPASAVPPLAGIPATSSAAPAAAVRPGTPAYSPAGAEPAEE